MKLFSFKGKRSASAPRVEKAKAARRKRCNYGFRSLAVLAMAFLLLAMAGTTFAWYIRNRQAKHNAVQVISQEAELKIGSYAIIKADRPTDGSEVSSARITTDTAVTLNEFDAVFANNNATPVYIRVELEGGKITPNTEQSYNVTIRNAGNAALYTEDGRTKMNTDLSNIVQVQWAVSPEMDECLDDETKTLNTRALNAYHEAAEGEWSDPTSFFHYIPEAEGRRTVLGPDNAKANTLVLEDVRVTADENGKACFYIRIDYCWPLVECYVNMEYGTARRLDQSVTTQSFLGDINTIEIEAAGATVPAEG